MHEPKAILRSVATASPGEPVSQESLKKILCDLWIGSDRALQTMLNVFDTSGVRSRHFALPLEAYVGLESFTQRNAQFIETARVLNVQAARKALARAGLLPEDVTHVLVVTSTGISTPSLDARLINDLPLPASVRRCPVWGLGCGAGGASLGLAADFARSSPDAVVLVVVVELCSLAFVPGTKTKLNLVASALFGDGAAAVVVTGSGAGLELTSHRTTTWPDTLDMMGWDVGEEGLGLVLSRNLPAFARERMPDVMGDLYASVGWESDELPAFAALHPGGPKVLAALAEGTGLPDHLLDPARRVLSRYGNMSAPTFLYVLEDILNETPEPAGPGIYSVMGPGFTCDCGVLTPVPVPAEA
jgi:alkylresorcinol/alkylpyrone synthase